MQKRLHRFHYRYFSQSLLFYLFGGWFLYMFWICLKIVHLTVPHWGWHVGIQAVHTSGWRFKFVLKLVICSICQWYDDPNDIFSKELIQPAATPFPNFDASTDPKIVIFDSDPNHRDSVPVWDRKVASHTKSLRCLKKLTGTVERSGQSFRATCGLWLPQVGYMTLRVTFGLFPHNDQLDRENADVQCPMIYHQKFG
jgi:hypothetical protein